MQKNEYKTIDNTRTFKKLMKSLHDIEEKNKAKNTISVDDKEKHK